MPMAELLPPPLKLALYDPDNRQAVVNFRVKDLGTARYKPTFERVEEGLKRIELEHAGFTCSLDGNPIRRWRTLYKIVSDLATSLGTAFDRDFNRNGSCVSFVEAGIDRDHSQHGSTGSCRNVHGNFRLATGYRQCLFVHNLLGNRRRRHDSLSVAISRRATASAGSTIGFAASFPGRWNWK